MRALLHENVYCLLLDGIFINQWVKLGAICNCPQIALSINIRSITKEDNRHCLCQPEAYLEF